MSTVKYLLSLSSKELNDLPYGAILLNKSGNIIFYNSYEEKISGRIASKVVGRHFFNAVAPCTNVAPFRSSYDEIMAGTIEEADLDFIFTFSPPMHVRIKMMSNRDNDTVWILVYRTPTK